MIESASGDQIFEYKFPEFLNNNNDIINSSNDFEVLQVLGSGTFGNVLKVKSKKNLEIYAIKRVDMERVSIDEKIDPKYYENERIILSTLRNHQICNCYNTFEEGKYLYFVMEFMNNGDLKSYFFGNKALESKIPEEKIWDFFFKCLSALLFIHSKGLIHRDIKLDNIFLDDNFNIKIGDFNVSAAIDEISAGNFTQDPQKKSQLVYNNSFCGSDPYISPEADEKNDSIRNYDQKTDVYSMGILFFILCYGKDPYYKGNNYIMEYFNKHLYSDDLNNIILKMIQKDKYQRFSCLEAYNSVKKYFIEKYVKNTAVKSSLNCFYNFPNFRDYFLNNNNFYALNNNNFYVLNSEKIEMGKSVFSSIYSLTGNNEELIDSCLFDIRKNMENYGLNVKYNEEIEVGKFIYSFVKILNSILN